MKLRQDARRDGGCETRHVASRRAKPPAMLIMHAIALLLTLASIVNAQQQGDGDRDDRLPPPPSTTISMPTTTSASSRLIVSTQTAVTLVESQVVQTSLDAGSSTPAQFFLAAPFKNASVPLYVTASLCSGPAVEPYDVNNSTVLKELGMDYYSALTSTLLSMYVSTNADNQSPGPDSTKGSPDIEYFFGGQAVDINTDRQPDGAWISIFPPEDARNATGTWQFSIGASTEGPLLTMKSSQGLFFADSDRTNALLSTHNSSQGLSPNLTLAILPTAGQGSLANSYYYNSSVCAISDAFTRFNTRANPMRISYNRTDTMRGSEYDNTTRPQWAASNLQANTNYTAWLIQADTMGIGSTTPSLTIWPAIKFVTKNTPICRLVWGVDFCPSVAYSIPIDPSISTDQALSVIEGTVKPNFANFSATLDTFPCGSSDFGQYSPLHTCDSCRRAYQDWLCAVTMPRCTDPLQEVDNQTSAAVPDVYSLSGEQTPTNSLLLPYVVNRRNDSRQSYIDNQLNAGLYGEVLPCISTCYAVGSSCPQPLMQWYCPQWDVTAQAQYGTFADAGNGGLGGGQNGGAGFDGQRWGGPSRYIAQDAFGNVYCNAMDTERSVVTLNGALAKRAPSIASVSFIALSLSFALPFWLL